MIAMRVTMQIEIDAALFKAFEIKPSGIFSSDKTQQLYQDKNGNGITLPHFQTGYSPFQVEDILNHFRSLKANGSVVSTHTFTTE